MHKTRSAMKRMAIFFDIDGTLLPEGETAIPEPTMVAVRAAQANGHFCVLNTGRSRGTVDPPLANAGFDGIISGLGTMATFGDNLLWQNLLEPETVRWLVEISRACGVKMIYEGVEAIGYDCWRFPPTEADRKSFARSRQLGRTIIEMGEHDIFPIAKLLVLPARGSDQARFFSLLEGFSILDYGNGWAEVVPAGFDKGVAMLRMLDYLGLPVAQSIAVGDSINDIPMLDATQNSVAMGNGAAKNHPVSFVTLPCGEGGIPHMLRHFALID